MAAGRWNKLGEDDGQFIYASALASHSMNKVWAWTPLSSDELFEEEEEKERERKRTKKNKRVRKNYQENTGTKLITNTKKQKLKI